MTDERSADVVRVLAGRKKHGAPVFEDVPAVECDGGRYVLTGSPGLALGAAAGDTIVVHGDATFDVVERGGNLAVQVFADRFDEGSLGELVAEIEQLGGRLDGGQDRLRVFTVPASAGFGAVEAAFDRYVRLQPGAEWYFGNVYDERDGVTPLNWWAS